MAETAESQEHGKRASLAEKCISCGVRLAERGFVRFPCPMCAYPIGRCVRCRKQSIIYKCPKCGFTGP